MAGYFITGTDTDVGKTRIALAFMHALQAQGKTVAGMKPVSAGCLETATGLRNEDAILLMHASSVALPYEIINPYAFKPAIAPHIAAQLSGVSIDIPHIQQCYKQIASQVDIVIVEGAGGWLVPINDTQTMADAAASLNLPVILVVGIRLGCLNHALLSAECIRAKELTLAAWVANCINPAMECAIENISTLTKRLSAPLLGTVPYNKSMNPHVEHDYLDMALLDQTAG